MIRACTHTDHPPRPRIGKSRQQVEELKAKLENENRASAAAVTRNEMSRQAMVAYEQTIEGVQKQRK